MKPFLYIWKCSLVNMIRQLPKKPGHFILVLIYLAFFVLAIVSVTFMPHEFGNTDISSSSLSFFIYRLVWLALSLLLGSVILYDGTSKGSAVFSSSDVQFLFTAPYKSQTILIYGLVGMLKTMGVAALFLPFQFPNLSRIGLNLRQLFLVVLLFIWSLVCFSLFSLILYLLAQNKPIVRRILRSAVIAVPVIILAVLLVRLILTRDLSALLSFPDSLWFRILPLYGWTVSLAQSIVTGFDTIGLISFACMVVMPFATFWLAYRMPADFYEDAIIRVEQKKEQIDRAESRRNTKVTPRQKKRKGMVGIGRGFGLNTLFYRYACEMRRKQPYFIGGLAILMIFITVGALSVSSRESTVAPFTIYFLFLIPFFQLFFRISESITVSELTRPLLYTLPYGAGPKLFWLTFTELVFNLPQIVPSLLIYTFWIRPPFHLVLTILPLLLTYPLIFTASSVLTYRIMGSSEGQLNALVQLMTSFILFAPSVILVITAITRQATRSSDPSLLFLLIAFIQTVLCSLIIYVAGKSALDNGLLKA